VVNSGGTGVAQARSLMNVASVNNAVSGFNASGVSQLAILNIASVLNYGYDVALNAVTDGMLSGEFVLSGTTSCFVAGEDGTNPGLAFSNGEECTVMAPSDASVTFDQTAALAFVAKVTDSDVANQSDENAADAAGGPGVAEFDNISDWISFDRPLRGWGADGAATSLFPSDNHRGPCMTGAICRIWDWNLLAQEAGDPLRGVVPAPADGDQTWTHTWSPTDQTGCDEIAGASFGSGLCTTVALRAAYEVMGDGIGNENGLCESSETCVVATNIGAYQGHGVLEAAAGGDIATGGALENIELLEYPSNGY
jgi:hypothetical protein